MIAIINMAAYINKIILLEYDPIVDFANIIFVINWYSPESEDFIKKFSIYGNTNRARLYKIPTPNTCAEHYIWSLTWPSRLKGTITLKNIIHSFRDLQGNEAKILSQVDQEIVRNIQIKGLYIYIYINYIPW